MIDKEIEKRELSSQVEEMESVNLTQMELKEK